MNDQRTDQEIQLTQFGITVRRGDELRMGWYETIFTLAQPIGGIHEVWLLEGHPLFTSENRCVVLSDGQIMVLLDRTLNRGLRLSLTRAQGWFELSVENSLVHLTHHPRHGSVEIAAKYSIDAHS